MVINVYVEADRWIQKQNCLNKMMIMMMAMILGREPASGLPYMKNMKNCILLKV